jgi:hypothetical protein
VDNYDQERERRFPVIFATRYGRGLPEKFKNSPALQKPIEFEPLAAALN